MVEKARKQELEPEPVEFVPEFVPGRRPVFEGTDPGPDLADWPDGPRGLFNAMCAGSGWTPADGPSPGVFRNRAKGHRCLWSCAWSTSKGLISPGLIAPVELMPDEMLLAEGLDYFYRGSLERELSLLLVDWLAGQVTSEGLWRSNMRKFLARYRGGVEDYLCPWDLPEKIIWAKYRPGWGG